MMFLVSIVKYKDQRRHAHILQCTFWAIRYAVMFFGKHCMQPDVVANMKCSHLSIDSMQIYRSEETFSYAWSENLVELMKHIIIVTWTGVYTIRGSFGSKREQNSRMENPPLRTKIITRMVYPWISHPSKSPGSRSFQISPRGLLSRFNQGFGKIY